MRTSPPDRRERAEAGLLDDDRFRILVLGLIFVLALLILTGRLYFLQINRGGESRRSISRQSERRVRLAGRRGGIYSSDRVMLAGNRQAYDLLFFPSEMHQGSRRRTVSYMNNCAAVLARAMERDAFPGPADFARHLITSPGVPMTVFRDLSTREVARALEASRQMKGVDVQFSPVRIYPQGPLAAHLVGYARKADAESAADREKFFYYNPDTEGVSGVEKAYDDFRNGALGLRAYPGRSVIQVNNIGYAHRELLGRCEPIHGSDVILTIDSRAQRIAEKLLDGRVGAMVAVDAFTGEIICAASSPRFDLSRFSPALSADYYRTLLDDPGKPLLNRAFQAKYPPGSTIKPLMCLAFLRSGIDPAEKIYCSGEIPVGNAVIRCSAHRFAGDDMDMVSALEKSCNTYMIHNALRVGLPPMASMLENAGFGRRTGLPLAETSGDFPSDALKRRLYKTPWNAYDTALVSIGQGIISVSPVQMAMYCAAIANGGTLMRPFLLRQILDSRGVVRFAQEPVALGKLNVSPEELGIIRQGMFQVVNAPDGSGWRGAVEDLTVYGKTGTAELGSSSDRRNITHFIAFTTFGKRTIALSVTVEDGLSGGRTCAPLAAAFFTRYLLDAPSR